MGTNEHILKFERDYERITLVIINGPSIVAQDIIDDLEANMLNEVEVWLMGDGDGLALRQVLGSLFDDAAERLEAAEREES